MAKEQFRVHKRLRDFWQTSKWDEILNFNFILLFSGWLVCFAGIILSVHTNFQFFIVILFAFLWTKLNSKFLKIITPPSELLILLLLIFGSMAFSAFQLFQVHTFLYPLNILLLTIILFLTGFLLVLNNDHKQGILFTLAFWGFTGYFLSFYDNFLLLIAFQFILFLILISRTRWLEKLTVVELWVSLVFFLILFNKIGDYDLYSHFHPEGCCSNPVVSGLYHFLFMLFRIYILAFIVKIPLVLVYNHAGLARKLKIAGIFQSTLPQFFQLVLLLLIFYFSISSWQAQNIRSAILNALHDIKTNQVSGVNYHLISSFHPNRPVELAGFKPHLFGENYPEMGVVQFNPESTKENTSPHYFLYFQEGEPIENQLHLIEIDSFFLKTFTPRINVMSGSGLMAYPYYANRRESYFYDIEFWQEDEYIKIFPFALLSKEPDWDARAYFTAVDSGQNEINISLKSNLSRLCAGRVYLPILKNNEALSPQYFTFDIFYALNMAFFNSQLGKILIGLIFAYFLINAFVIKSVTRFGDEITRLIIRKFKQLKEGILEISRGNLNYKVHVEGEDEFAELAAHFNSMSEQLNTSIDYLKEKERLDQELKIARDVQLSLLADELPVAGGYQFVSRLETAAEVGGDFFDIIQFNSHQYLFTIGDVSGKGTSAAFYMAQFLSLLRFSAQFTIQPDEIALRINDYFSTEVKAKQIFVTAIIGILDTQKHTIRFIRAGHCLPVFLPYQKTAEVREITSSGLGIGLINASDQFKELTEVKEMKLNAGDRIILYTDGIVEAARKMKNHPEKEELYGEERFRELLLTTAEDNSETTGQKIIEDIQNFYKQSPPYDDYTILIIQREK